MAAYWIYTGKSHRVTVHDGACHYHREAKVAYGENREKWNAQWRGPFPTFQKALIAAGKIHKNPPVPCHRCCPSK